MVLWSRKFRTLIDMDLSILALHFSLFLVVLTTNDGLTNVVEWDSYSAIIHGKRLFIYSGEFHYQRLPVPELWLDIFQKFKANGLNAVR